MVKYMMYLQAFWKETDFMNLSISNIAWADENDNCVYSLMQKYGYTGLEIAPTRIFPENPYSNLIEAKNWGD